MSDIVDFFRNQRLATSKFGAMTDHQILHLKVWFFGAADHIQKGQFELQINIDTKNILYAVTTDAKPTEGYKARLKIMTKWIHMLLGDDWSVRVEDNGKKVFTGKRKSIVKKNELKLQPD